MSKICEVCNITIAIVGLALLAAVIVIGSVTLVDMVGGKI